MAITAVGTQYHIAASKTLSVTPTTLGDVLVLGSTISLSADPVTAVSGGGVTTWHQLAVSSVTGSASLWYGVVTTTGSSTITITTVAPSAVGLLAQQYTAGAGITWSQDGSGGTGGAASGVTSGTYPSLTPANAGELFVGCFYASAGSLGGSTSGYTYYSGSTAFATDSQFVYHLSAPNPADPAFTCASSGTSIVSALLIATGSSPTGGFFLL